MVRLPHPGFNKFKPRSACQGPTITAPSLHTSLWNLQLCRLYVYVISP